MSYPDARYFGEAGEVSAVWCPAGAEPDLRIGPAGALILFAPEAPREAYAPGADDAGPAPPVAGHETFAGTVAGLGAGEVERRHLSPTEIEQIVVAEITDRETVAAQLTVAGRPDDAERLRQEAAVLRAHLDG